MSRLVFVNRFYWPDTPATAQLLTDLATAAAAAGKRVLVLTSGDGARPAHETHEGVDIVRIRSVRGAHPTIVGKAVGFGTFFVLAVVQLLRIVRREDTVVVMTDPPLLSIAAAAVVRLKHAKLVHWIQDVYPEVAIAVTGHRWLAIAVPFRNWAWRRAARCIAISEDMAQRVSAAGVDPARVHTIPNWAPAGVQPVRRNDATVEALRRDWGLEGKFVVEYSGNLGRVHALEPVIEAAAECTDDRIAFLFIGGGAQRRSLEAEVSRRNLKNVQFRPSQPRERLSVSLGLADVHVITLRSGCEYSVFPSKLYGIAAAGRPVLYVGPLACELARLVTRYGLGRALAADKPKEIAAAIQQLRSDETALERCTQSVLQFAQNHTAESAAARWLPHLIERTTC